jgi:hypothetical protein
LVALFQRDAEQTIERYRVFHESAAGATKVIAGGEFSGGAETESLISE